jgi:hypothetical protein
LSEDKETGPAAGKYDLPLVHGKYLPGAAL